VGGGIQCLIWIRGCFPEWGERFRPCEHDTNDFEVKNFSLIEKQNDLKVISSAISTQTKVIKVDSFFFQVTDR
jgi:hypothetical protein